MASARTAPRPGAEAGPLHRLRGRSAVARARSVARRPGCWPTPTPTRSGCPTRACRSSTRSSTSAPDAVAERAYAPWTDLEALLRGRGLPLFSVDTHRAGRRLRHAGLQPVGRARLHEPPQLHRPGRRAGAGRRPRPERPARRRRRALHLQPRAARRLRRLLRAGRRRGGRRRDHRGRRRAGRPAGAPRSRASVLRALAGVDGRVRAVACTTSPTTAPRIASVTPRYPDVPEQVEKRTIADLGRLALPQAPARAAHRGGARPPQRRGLPGLHPGLPLLPGRA